MENIVLNLNVDISGFENDISVLSEALCQNIEFNNRLCELRTIKYVDSWYELQLVTIEPPKQIIDAIRFNDHKVKICNRSFIMPVMIQSDEEDTEWDVKTDSIFLALCEIIWDHCDVDDSESSLSVFKRFIDCSNETLLSPFKGDSNASFTSSLLNLQYKIWRLFNG